MGRTNRLLGVGLMGLLSLAGCDKKGATTEGAPASSASAAATNVGVAVQSPSSAVPPGSSGAPIGCDIKKAGDCERECLTGAAEPVLRGRVCANASALLLQPGAQDNPTLRAKLNQKGCDLENGKSCSRLGTQYDKGDGVTKSSSKAVENWELACAKSDAIGCYSAGLYYGDWEADRPQDMAKADTLLTKGCTFGEKAACEAKGNPILVVGIEDIVASPAKFEGKHVYLKNVAVRRGSPTSGVVLKPGGSPALDGIPSTIAADADETRRKWARLPTPVRGATVKFVEAMVEKQMARDERVRFVVMDIGDLVP